MSDVKRSGTYDVFKKSAAAKFSLIPPTYADKGWVERNGAIFVEVATAVGEDANGNITYNWGEKITFSLGMNDLALLFEDFSKSLVHVYQGTNKALQFQAGQGKYEGTYMMSVSSKDAAGVQKRITVPVSAGEAAVLTRLLGAATSKLIGW